MIAQQRLFILPLLPLISASADDAHDTFGDDNLVAMMDGGSSSGLDDEFDAHFLLHTYTNTNTTLAESLEPVNNSIAPLLVTYALNRKASPSSGKANGERKMSKEGTMSGSNGQSNQQANASDANTTSTTTTTNNPNNNTNTTTTTTPQTNSGITAPEEKRKKPKRKHYTLEELGKYIYFLFLRLDR